MSVLERLFANVWFTGAVKVIAAFVLLLVVVILLVWAERKIVADMQNRIGPNRAGPWGILQTLADGLKLLFKESVVPRRVELLVYLAAPIAAMAPAFLIFLMIPVGRPFHVGETLVTLQVADLNVALPLDHFLRLAEQGAIGRLYPWMYSFMGYLPQSRQLVTETAPAVARRLAADGVDAVFLTPC